MSQTRRVPRSCSQQQRREHSRSQKSPSTSGNIEGIRAKAKAKSSSLSFKPTADVDISPIEMVEYATERTKAAKVNTDAIIADDKPIEQRKLSQMERLEALLSRLPNVNSQTDERHEGSETAHISFPRGILSDIANANSSEVLSEVVKSDEQSKDANTRTARMREWLEGLDNGKGAFLSYLEVINDEFDCDFAQLRALVLVTPCAAGLLGTIDPCLWEVCGIRSMGHRLLFAKALNHLDKIL